MRISLVGADFEENLGVGMIAAVATAAGHRVQVAPFNRADEVPALAARIAREQPDVVGLSMQFQHRSREFLGLARRLRKCGYAGHITAGGQYATLAWREVVGGGHGVDTVVLHDGEAGFRELCEALERRQPLEAVRGLALRGEGGVVRTPGRGLTDDLDALPFPRRYRAHARHLGVPFVPIMGSRGCWGSCSYCSITSFYRDAKAHGGGKTLRMRSPANLAEEMAGLAKRAGGRALFCFHDDNFLLPKPEHTLARLWELRRELDQRGVGEVAMIGKCRPETLTDELARELSALGVIRLYVGVENASASGAAHLRRGKQHTAVRAALRACREAGIFVCYNLLVFEPGARLDDVRENVAFIREHAAHPINFCRAEPYIGTPLQQELSDAGALGGSYLGYDYRIGDDQAELLFRISAAAFRERNFAPNGVGNRYMGLGYNLNILERFYGPHADLARRVNELTRAISLDTAEHLEQAIQLVESGPSADEVERETALLGLRIAASDTLWHGELDQLFAAMARASAPPARQRVRRVARLAGGVAMGASLALTAAGCGGDTVDPVPPDAGDAGDEGIVADPPPWDAGDEGIVADPLPPDGGDAMVADPPPWDAGDDGMVVDPPPPDASDAPPPVDPAPVDAGDDADGNAMNDAPRRLIDQWVDTAPRRARRSDDLPLYQPPSVALAVERDGDEQRVTLEGGPEAVSVRWEADGVVEGDGREVRWRPSGAEHDRIRVAVRSAGGVAVVSARARS